MTSELKHLKSAIGRPACCSGPGHVTLSETDINCPRCCRLIAAIRAKGIEPRLDNSETVH